MNQPGGTDFLSRSYNIGGNDVSVATIIVVVFGATLAFGTSWLTGVFSSIGLAGVITLIALLLAWQNRRESLNSAIMQFFVFFIIFRAGIWFLADYLPRTMTNLDVSAWSGVREEFAAASPLAEPELFPVAVDVAATPVITDHTTYTTPPQPAAPSAPTATPDPVLPLLAQLNAAVAAYDMPAAETAVTAIQRIEPNNPQALAVRAQLDAAQNQRAAMQSLPPTADSAAGAQAMSVRDALAGGRYQIIDDGKRWNAFACGETSTVQVLTGWLAGERFTVARCLLDQFGAGSTSDVFEVR